ncbi:MAG: 30S ribosome-binding factor RbfA [Proteobacteria bacterium]|nr:30S ribosome-binding factor RbfA [Pseudomonadota bacterium]
MSPSKSKPGQPNQRKQRVEHAIREALVGMVRDDIKDPRVRAATLITVTKVELNVDLAVANVYVSIVGDDATVDACLVGLQKSAGFLRGPLGRELQLQRAPELRFHIDKGIDMSEKLAQILRDDALRAKAAGREVGQAEPTPIAPSLPDPEDDAT